jgi:hypothetical protein
MIAVTSTSRLPSFPYPTYRPAIFLESFSAFSGLGGEKDKFTTKYTEITKRIGFFV